MLSSSHPNPCLYALSSSPVYDPGQSKLAQPITVWETCSLWLLSLAPILYRLKGLELTGTYGVH